VENRDLSPRTYQLALEAPEGFELVAGENPITLAPATRRELRVFVAVSPGSKHALAQPIAFALRDVARPERAIRRPTTFVFSFGASDDERKHEKERERDGSDASTLAARAIRLALGIAVSLAFP
jgi:hypothetical protein